MSLTGKVLRNAAVQVVSQALTWVMAWGLLLYLPRYLGDDGFGRLFFAISFSMVASMFLNLGINTYLMKQVSRSEGEGADILANVMGVKVLLAFVVYGLMLLVTRTMDLTPAAVTATDIIGLSFVVGSFGLTFSSFLQGVQRAWAPAAALIAEKAVVTGASIGLLVAGKGLVAVAWAHLAGALVSTAMLAYWTYRGMPFRMSFDGSVIRRVLRGSAPFLIWIVFGEIYVRIDVLMLTSMTSDEVVGWYGAAFRLYGTLLFIPNIFMNSVFPAIAGKFASPGEDAHVATRRTFSFMLLASVPVGLGMSLVAGPTVKLLFGLEQFAPAVENLEIFGMSMVLVCLNVVLGSVLIASDLQGAWAKAAVAAAVLNPLMNLVLIPYFQNATGNGGYGAALATLATEVFLAGVALRLLPRGIFDARSCWVGFKTVGAGVCMMTGVAWLGDGDLVRMILVGSVTYLGAAALLQVIPRQDMAHLVHALHRRS